MIGTRAWLDMTGGTLSRRERLVHQAGAVAVLTTDMPSRIRLRWAKGAPDLDVNVRPPSSDLVRAASAWAGEVHEPWLMAHGLRTWRFGHLLGQLDGFDADPETFFLACLLHDVGLTDTYRVPAPPTGDLCRCFAAHGAHISEEKLLELGASPLLASEVADAIGMHLNATVDPTWGAAAHLLNAGAALDVVGTRAAALGVRVIRQVLAAHDRTGFADELLAVVRAENRARPDARMASLFGVGMGPAVRLNPLNRL